MTFQWLTLTQFADQVSSQMNQQFTEEQVMGLAADGSLRVGAVIPTWLSPGEGELIWHLQDGSALEPSWNHTPVITDGVARWLTTAQIETLMLHGSVTLAGTRWEVPHESAPDISLLTAGPASPRVNRSHLRIPTTELEAVVNTDRRVVTPATAQTTQAAKDLPSGEEACEENPFKAMNRWQQLAAECYALRNPTSALPPSEQQASRSLLQELKNEMASLESESQFREELRTFVSALSHQSTVGMTEPENRAHQARLADYQNWYHRLVGVEDPNVQLVAESYEWRGNEPRLNAGRNARLAFEKWVQHIAHELKHADDSRTKLAERILAKAQRFSFESERGSPSVSSIEKMLPAGICGPRGHRSKKARK